MMSKKLDIGFSYTQASSFLNDEFIGSLLLNIDAAIWMQMFHYRNLMTVLQILTERKYDRPLSSTGLHCVGRLRHKFFFQ